MIVSAAVKIFDKRQNKALCLKCHRHCDIYEILHDFGYRRDEYETIAQGFLDEEDNFYSRVDAWRHAVAYEQITGTKPEPLFSEMLW